MYSWPTVHIVTHHTGRAMWQDKVRFRANQDDLEHYLCPALTSTGDD